MSDWTAWQVIIYAAICVAAVFGGALVGKFIVRR